jgi:hypothetical protein
MHALRLHADRQLIARSLLNRQQFQILRSIFSAWQRARWASCAERMRTQAALALFRRHGQLRLLRRLQSIVHAQRFVHASCFAVKELMNYGRLKVAWSQWRQHLKNSVLEQEKQRVAAEKAQILLRSIASHAESTVTTVDSSTVAESMVMIKSNAVLTDISLPSIIENPPARVVETSPASKPTLEILNIPSDKIVVSALSNLLPIPVQALPVESKNEAVVTQKIDLPPAPPPSTQLSKMKSVSQSLRDAINKVQSHLKTNYSHQSALASSTSTSIGMPEVKEVSNDSKVIDSVILQTPPSVAVPEVQAVSAVIVESSATEPSFTIASELPASSSSISASVHITPLPSPSVSMVSESTLSQPTIPDSPSVRLEKVLLKLKSQLSDLPPVSSSPSAEIEKKSQVDNPTDLTSCFEESAVLVAPPSLPNIEIQPQFEDAAPPIAVSVVAENEVKCVEPDVQVVTPIVGDSSDETSILAPEVASIAVVTEFAHTTDSHIANIPSLIEDVTLVSQVSDVDVELQHEIRLDSVLKTFQQCRVKKIFRSWVLLSVSVQHLRMATLHRAYKQWKRACFHRHCVYEAEDFLFGKRMQTALLQHFRAWRNLYLQQENIRSLFSARVIKRTRAFIADWRDMASEKVRFSCISLCLIQLFHDHILHSMADSSKKNDAAGLNSVYCCQN